MKKLRELLGGFGKAANNEAEARKARSIAILKSEGIPYLPALPVIESGSEVRWRSSHEAAGRAMALCGVAMKGAGVEAPEVKDFMEEFSLEPLLSPEEKVFMKKAKPAPKERVPFSWRIEAAWALFWALGFEAKLERPAETCDVPKALGFLRKNGREGFLQKAGLRPKSEILDALDLTYRYHWALVDARLNEKPAPGGLSEGVVAERHRALNWLAGYSDGEAWDDVTTDT